MQVPPATPIAEQLYPLAAICVKSEASWPVNSNHPGARQGYLVALCPSPGGDLLRSTGPSALACGGGNNSGSLVSLGNSSVILAT